MAERVSLLCHRRRRDSCDPLVRWSVLCTDELQIIRTIVPKLRCYETSGWVHTITQISFPPAIRKISGPSSGGEGH